MEITQDKREVIRKIVEKTSPLSPSAERATEGLVAAVKHSFPDFTPEQQAYVNQYTASVVYEGIDLNDTSLIGETLNDMLLEMTVVLAHTTARLLEL